MFSYVNLLHDRLQNLQLTCCSWSWLTWTAERDFHRWVQDFCQVIYRCPAPLLCKPHPVSLTVCTKYVIDVLSGDTLQYIAWNFFGLVYPILFQQTTIHCGFMATDLMIYTHSHRWMKCVAKQGLLPHTRYSVKTWEFLWQVLYTSMSVFC